MARNERSRKSVGVKIQVEKIETPEPPKEDIPTTNPGEDGSTSTSTIPGNGEGASITSGA